ncbi:MAG TPA: deoxyribodipyrimidine photo-lyase [Microlunatus sp.]
MAERATSIAVFNRNLRTMDNPVLAAAAESEQVVPVFVQDRDLVGSGFSNRRRQHFLNAGLTDLDASLRQLGAELIFRRGDPVAEIIKLASTLDAQDVHIAADVSRYAQRREDRLRTELSRQRRRLIVHDAVTTVHPAGAITPQGSDHFSVFTPYYRRWSGMPVRPVLPRPNRLLLPEGIKSGSIPAGQVVAGWEGGESAARQLANDWFADGLEAYEDRHDDLAGDGTSHLSPYLHFGFLSPVELATKAGERSGPGAAAFVRQLAWRDFHHQVLAARPAAAWRDYRSHQDQWLDDEKHWDAWRNGLTGYPLVDAGMRQLNEVGWMHNRARMIVASFLTKTLYLDWRRGARFFLEELLDGDIANNNLNWQWVAGTGTDTRPNRVLNPLRQARFDPEALYVRRWVPELAGIENPADAHQPWRLDAAQRRGLHYPAPLVDLAEARDNFLRRRERP